MRSRTVPPVGEGADLGADHVVEGEDWAVGSLGGRGPERLLEDVDLALLAGVRVGDEEPAAERVGLDMRGPPAARVEAGCEGATILSIGAGVSVATSRSRLKRSTRP